MVVNGLHYASTMTSCKVRTKQESACDPLSKSLLSVLTIHTIQVSHKRHACCFQKSQYEFAMLILYTYIRKAMASMYRFPQQQFTWACQLWPCPRSLFKDLCQLMFPICLYDLSVAETEYTDTMCILLYSFASPLLLWSIRLPAQQVESQSPYRDFRLGAWQ